MNIRGLIVDPPRACIRYRIFQTRFSPKNNPSAALPTYCNCGDQLYAFFIAITVSIGILHRDPSSVPRTDSKTQSQITIHGNK